MEAATTGQLGRLQLCPPSSYCSIYLTCVQCDDQMHNICSRRSPCKTNCDNVAHLRLQENDRGDDKIRQLIDTLDMRKDEAIERTFKGVAKQFRDIFAQVGWFAAMTG